MQTKRIILILILVAGVLTVLALTISRLPTTLLIAMETDNSGTHLSVQGKAVSREWAVSAVKQLRANIDHVELKIDANTTFLDVAAFVEDLKTPPDSVPIALIYQDGPNEVKVLADATVFTNPPTITVIESADQGDAKHDKRTP